MVMCSLIRALLGPPHPSSGLLLTSKQAENTGRPNPSSSSQSESNAAHRIVREILDPRLSVTDISPSGELIRAIDRFNNNRESTNITPTISQSPNLNEATRGAIRATIAHVRDRDRDNRQEIRAILDEMPVSEVAGFRDILREESFMVANSIRRSRPRMTESSRYLERHRRLAETTNPMSSNTSSSLSDLHPAGEQYDAARQHMRALLDSQDYLVEGARSHGTKRRKIDNGTSISGFPGFSYGHYGQVEPGKLKMEIESCDGGTYSLDWYGDGSVDSSAYSAANVLKNDDSVYCTKGNRCNLILRHQGATPFCLTELIIKGPPRHYTDP